MDILNNIEASILLFFQQIRNPVTDTIMTVFSVLGNFGLIWIIIAVILLIRKKTRRHGIQLAFCLIASVLLSNVILKNLVARPRPFTEIEGLTVMLSPQLADAGSWSFPSGHSSGSFAAAWSLNCSFAKKARWSWLVAALIALSRSYIGVHYLSDIIGGAFFGTVAAIIAVMLWRKLTPAAEKLNII